ncbi:MAG: GNAT family N-acetyltransferase [Clostridia bacterium]|nr:GNAT family N-acetyltransferase [Clostridia bacterium]
MEYKCYDSLPAQAREIREEVFMREQGFLEEFDLDDKYATHILAFDGLQAVATCRFFEQDGFYLIGRIAVLKEYRGKGVGRDMLEYAEKCITKFGGKEIRIHAQQNAEEFYKKLGYQSLNIYDYEQDCKHVWMSKTVE